MCPPGLAGPVGFTMHTASAEDGGRFWSPLRNMSFCSWLPWVHEILMTAILAASHKPFPHTSSHLFSPRVVIHSLFNCYIHGDDFELHNSGPYPSNLQECNFRFPISHPPNSALQLLLPSWLPYSLTTSFLGSDFLAAAQSSFVFCFLPDNFSSYKLCL